MEICYLGHATFRFVTPEGRVILVDPWIFGNPLCPPEFREVGAVDLILVTHGHADHLGDVFPIAQTTGARVVTVVELGKWLGAHGLRNIGTMNVGGLVQPIPGVRVVMTEAAHSSSVDPDPHAYVGVAAGYVLEFSDGSRVYHAGDTAAFAGMRLIAEVHRPDLALLPMGDHHTMGPEEAAHAARLLRAKQVVPMHFGIAPESRSAPEEFRVALRALEVSDVEVLRLAPGDRVTRVAGRWQRAGTGS